MLYCNIVCTFLYYNKYTILYYNVSYCAKMSYCILQFTSPQYFIVHHLQLCNSGEVTSYIIHHAIMLHNEIQYNII